VIKTVAAALLLTVAVPALAAESVGDPSTTLPVAARGKMLVAADGSRLAPIYRVSADGAQIILDGRMVTVPTASIKNVDGKLTTSLSKAQVISLQ
jgi:hypothetical protein